MAFKIHFILFLTSLCVAYEMHHCENLSSLGAVSDQHIKIHVAALPAKYKWDHPLFKQFLPWILEPRWGKPIDNKPGQHLWATDQFALSQHFHDQFVASPLLVDTWQEADFVYVPLLILDLFVFMWSGEMCPKDYNCTHFLKEFMNEAHELLPGLGTKPHLLICSATQQSMAWSLEGMTSAELEIVHNFTYFTIETDMQHRHATLWNVEGMAGITHGSHNWLAVPYPGLVHFSRAYPYDAHHDPSHTVPEKRTTLVSETFIARTGLRKILQQQCMARNQSCIDFAPFAAERFDVKGIATLNENSVFCLQPPGDTYSRRSLFDCLPLGCIPVVFETVWVTAFPFSDVLNVSLILVDLASIVDKVKSNELNVVDVLAYFPAKDVIQRQDYVRRHGHVFAYMLDPVHELLTVDRLQHMDCMDDAFTFSIKQLMRNLCRRRLISKERCLHSTITGHHN